MTAAGASSSSSSESIEGGLSLVIDCCSHGTTYACIAPQVQRSVSRSVNSRITSAERGISNKMENELKSTVVSASGAWRTPFYLLVGIVGALVLLAYMKYRELRKEHLL